MAESIKDLVEQLKRTSDPRLCLQITRKISKLMEEQERPIEPPKVAR